jgi:hypothetical protein
MVVTSMGMREVLCPLIDPLRTDSFALANPVDILFCA